MRTLMLVLVLTAVSVAVIGSGYYLVPALRGSSTATPPVRAASLTGLCGAASDDRFDSPAAGRRIFTAVIAVDSPERVAGLQVTGFDLFDRSGAVTSFERLLAVEELARPLSSDAAVGDCAQWLESTDAGTWDGVLRPGTTRLRIVGAFPTPASADAPRPGAEGDARIFRYRVAIGDRVADGLVTPQD